jgi:hypothetical protein
MTVYLGVDAVIHVVKCFVLTGSIGVFFNRKPSFPYNELLSNVTHVADFSSLMDETTYSHKSTPGKSFLSANTKHPSSQLIRK